MALIGELSDLSLGELIEFFCNQRKTGRLKVIYPVGSGLFYLKAGGVVHAEFGELRGIDAVYYALTQPNASFTFNAAFEPPEQSINQPWTSVVLEGLRRMDQGIQPPNPFPNGVPASSEEKKTAVASVQAKQTDEPVVVKEPRTHDSIVGSSKDPDVKAFGVLLSQSGNSGNFQNKRWSTPAVIGAIALLIAVIGVPWGWYAHSKARRSASAPNKVAENPPVATSPSTADVSASPSVTETTSNISSAEPDALAAKRQAEARAKERAKMSAQEANVVPNSQPAPETAAKATNPTNQKSPGSQTSASRKVTVQVTYDENGRVTGASGGDATAVRIARQKRFPAGKPGSATVTIPIN
jgi:hypothetical protein